MQLPPSCLQVMNYTQISKGAGVGEHKANIMEWFVLERAFTPIQSPRDAFY